MDDDKPINATIRPVMPARAGDKPPDFIGNPWSESGPGLSAIRPAKPQKGRKPQEKPLPRSEIARITKKRKQNLKKATERARRLRPGPLAKKAPKNPNRPKELKHQLRAVLTAVSTMAKPEAAVFTQIMQLLETRPRSERKRVLNALAQVHK